MKNHAALAVLLAASLGSCQKQAETTPPKTDDHAPPTAQADATDSEPSLVDTWYSDLDGDGVPDLVELELNDDPKLDECMKQACGEAEITGLVAEINTLVILDVSGSMAGKVASGDRKLDLARDAIVSHVESLPRGEIVRSGLLTFGHKGDNTEAGKQESCASFEVLQQLGPVDPGAVEKALAPLEPTGWSPIADAFNVAGEVLPEQVGAINHVVLVADGIERCDGDPVAVVRRLRETNRLGVVDVVGIGLEAREDVETLKAIAEAGGGTYFESGDFASFHEAFNVLNDRLWKEYDAWLCSLGSAPLLACYERRAEQAIARVERELETIQQNATGESAAAELEEIKLRVERTRDGRQRVITTYQVKLEELTLQRDRVYQEMLKLKRAREAKF